MIETITLKQGTVRLWRDELPFRLVSEGRWQAVALPVPERPVPKLTTFW